MKTELTYESDQCTYTIRCEELQAGCWKLIFPSGMPLSDIATVITERLLKDEKIQTVKFDLFEKLIRLDRSTVTQPFDMPFGKKEVLWEIGKQVSK